jgi:hypothetical protein
MNVTIPAEYREFVAAQVAKLGLSGPDAYFEILLAHAADQEFLASRRSEPLGEPSVLEDFGMTQEEFDAILLEGINSGPSTEMTKEDWDELERRVWERHEQAKVR